MPASVEAPPIYTPTSANRRPRRYKFRRARPATSPCLLALPADARQSPKEKARARKPTTANRAAVNWICVSGYNREVCSVDMGAVSHVFADLSWRRGLCAKKPRVGIANGGKVTGGRRRRKRGAGGRARCMRWSRRALFGCAALKSAHPSSRQTVSAEVAEERARSGLVWVFLDRSAVILAVPATDPIELTGDSGTAPELLALPISAGGFAMPLFVERFFLHGCTKSSSQCFSAYVTCGYSCF